MKKILSVFMVLLLLTGCQTKSSNEFTVGVIQWAEHPALNESLEGMKKGLEEAGIADRVNVIVKNANDDASNAAMIASQFVNDKVDLIFAIATPSAQAAMVAANGKTPVVFSAVSDAKASGLVATPEKPEANVTGVSDLPPLDKQVALMKEMLPSLTRIGILFNTGEVNSQIQIADVRKIAEPLGLEVIDKGVSAANEIGDAAKQIANDTDALFIVNDNLIAGAAGLVVDQALKLNKPVFMAESGQFDQGIFASDSVSYFKLGVQSGHMIKDILVDKKPIAEIAVQTATDTELFVSQGMADKLGIEIPASVLERAIVK